MAHSSDTPAVSKALQLPEIIGCILSSFIKHSLDWDGYDAYFPAALLTSSGARRVYLTCGNEDRRQLYATFVKEAQMATWNDWAGPDTHNPLDGLAFPRLKSLELLVNWGDPIIPCIAATQLTKLNINPHTEVYPNQWVDVDEMAKVLDQIPVCASSQTELFRPVITILTLESFP
ncbi:hypothetical protein BDV12DRAFT_203911 [Aspergillus spectabilis]